MDKKNQEIIGRRSLVTGMGAAVAGIAVTAAASAQAQPSSFEPARHAIDSWMGEIPGNHHIFPKAHLRKRKEWKYV